ncbi:MAG: bifunctional pyr operon transcriptional regulator/uracil phosphoribosyltransferase PyrR [Pseudomonadales bacterium]|nr:bifunctional pyr operon transcriptional regulator/uracil phosphoribosyltransferase PyrR [Pseudomonadales bacterium]
MILPEVGEVLQQIATDLKAYLEDKHISDPAMVGIHTGGAWLAEDLHSQLELAEPLGTLDITFYRDDFTRSGLHPRVKPSQLPFSVEDRHIILVDDVIMSGRTIRAALNELFDYGRPASVTLVALLDLNARELPIRADIVGQTLALKEGERVKLTGPNPLAVELIHYKPS